MSTEVTVRGPRQQASALPAKLQYAHELANSGLLPSAFRRNPANVLWAMEYADMLGLAPMVAMTGIHVIEGKPTASAGLISGLVRAAGHKLRVTGNNKSATCVIIRSDDPGSPFEVTWTLRKNSDDNPSAEEAGLLGKNTWKNYPSAMLKSRAITQCARDACEEVLYGLHYTPEELGAEVDEDGAVVGAVEDEQPVVTVDGSGTEEDPWYVHPDPDAVAAAAEWVAASLRIIPDLGMEACRKLWREAFEKGRSGEVPKQDAEKVLNALKARMEQLKGAATETEQPPPSEAEVIEGTAVTLDLPEAWRDKVADIKDGPDADGVIRDAGEQLGNGEMEPDLYARVTVAVETRLSELGISGQAAA